MYFKKENQKTPELPIKDFTKIQDIFSRKQWPIEGYFGDDIFDNFCKMLARLESEQRDLIISLTEKFLWVQDSSYMKHFSVAFEKFITEYKFIRGKKIYICPLLPEDDFGKPKSSVALFYHVKASISAIQKKYSDFQISMVDSPSAIDVDMIKNGYTLCLIDDFVGTGETAERAVEYFLKRDICKDMITIISLVGMEFGLDELNQKGYITYTDISCKKGISCNGRSSEAELMEKIEQEIKIDEDYKFGYKGSEALVKMIRTPNNTFPIYWYRGKKNKYAPFPR